MIKTLSKKAGFVLAVAGAAVIGGATTALVAAAIPDSGGTIHGCYSKITGALKVVDNEAGKSCNGLENSLTWSASSANSGGIKGYAHTTYDSDTGVQAFDASRSKNIIVSNPAAPNCLTLTNGVPTTVAATHDTGTSQSINVSIKDQYGWTNTSDGAYCDQNAPGSNISVGSGYAYYLIVY